MTAAQHGSRAGCGIGRLLRNDTGLKMAAQALRMALGEYGDILTDVIPEILAERKGDRSRSAGRLKAKREKAVDEYLRGNITAEELELVRKKYDSEEKLLLGDAEVGMLDEDEVRRYLSAVLSGDEPCTPFWQAVIYRITVSKDGLVSVELSEWEHVYLFRLTEDNKTIAII